MLLSRPSLIIVEAAGSDRVRTECNYLRVDEDGTTVATDGHIAVAVSPVPRKTYFPVPENGRRTPARGICLRPGLVEEAIRNMPKGEKNAAMQYAAFTKITQDSASVATVCHDSQHTAQGAVGREPYPKWRGLFRNVWKKIAGMANATGGRICFKRSRLLNALRILDNAAGEDGLVFIEFGDGGTPMLLRSVNPRTKQTVMMIVRPATLAEGEWMEHGAWEHGILESFSSENMRKKKPAVRVEGGK